MSEPKTLQVRNRPFKIVPPAQLRVFAIPSKELDLSEECAIEPMTILLRKLTMTGFSVFFVGPKSIASKEDGGVEA